MTNHGQKTTLVHWGYIFGSATLVGVVFLAQAYVTAGNTQQVFHWKQQIVQAASTWYLWALIFPVILFLARMFPLNSENRTRSVLVHIVAGATVAILHAEIQNAANSLILNSRLEWVPPEKLLSLFFWRFFVYQGIFAICVAIDYYRRAREVDVESSRIEAGIFQAEIETLRMQLDPDFLYRSLQRLSTLMHLDLDEADTMVARLGDYLRTTLDGSGKSEVPLRHEVEFVRCYLELENITIHDRVNLDLDIDDGVMDQLVPGLILLAPVEDAIRSGAVRIGISAKAGETKLCLRIQHAAQTVPRKQQVGAAGCGLE